MMPSTPAVIDARTLLFVPGHRPDRFAKAAVSGADGIILDLEDAVGSDRKNEARDAVISWLSRDGDGIVRINAPGTAWFDDDLKALGGEPRTVMVPKATPASAAEVARLLAPGSRILALIETAAGVLEARATATTVGVCRLALGNVDLGAELGIDPNDHCALLTVRSTLVLAAASAGLAPPIDGVTTSLDDSDALFRDVRHALAVGFTGKLCIHPRQIPIVHEAFAPDPDQVRHAERILAAAADDGTVTVLDDKMIDKPVIDLARRLVRSAHRGLGMSSA